MGYFCLIGYSYVYVSIYIYIVIREEDMKFKRQVGVMGGIGVEGEMDMMKIYCFYEIFKKGNEKI